MGHDQKNGKPCPWHDRKREKPCPDHDGNKRKPLVRDCSTKPSPAWSEFTRAVFFLAWFVCFLPVTVRAESQGSDYKGITDPFGDPANYEFAEDEKEDKEFFHLGRYIMLGVDVGATVFTGGLGATVQPSAAVGGKLLYFFDKSICLEASAHYSNHLDEIVVANTSPLRIDTSLTQLKLGFRYYFDTKSAPKAVAVANPYLAFGGGVYLRNQSVINNSPGFTVDAGSATSSNFGGYFGGGVEFNIYRRHVYLGLDLRYHMVFFSDEDSNFGVDSVDRGGDIFMPLITLTYNF